MAPAQGRAETKCVWLNAATAAGVLGGNVQMTVTVAPDSDKTTEQDATGHDTTGWVQITRAHTPRLTSDLAGPTPYVSSPAASIRRYIP